VIALNELPAQCFAPGGWRDVKCLKGLQRAVGIREDKAQARVQALIDFQLSAMYYECYCDLVVSYDTSMPMSLQSLLLFKKIQTGDADIEYRKYNLEDAVWLCASRR